MSVIVDGKVKLTYQEYRHFPDDGNRHELIDGEHYMAPAPGTHHQSVSRHIQFQLYRQLEEQGLAQVYDAPTDVELSRIDVVQPDLAVVSREREHIVSPSRIIGAPDLVVEIVSPSTGPRDRELKRLLYERRGVPVYWLVDPDAQTVTVYETSGSAPGHAASPYRRMGTFHDRVELRLGALRATVDLRKVW
jgi:Uma2 family endonuclease